MQAIRKQAHSKWRYKARVSGGNKPMAFGEHLLRVLTMDEGAYSKDEIRELLGTEESETGIYTVFDLACAECFVWLFASARWNADYLLDCLNERYGRPMILNAVEAVGIRLEEAMENPLPFAMRLPFPVRLTMLVTALVKNLGPTIAKERANYALESPAFRAPEPRPPITFPDHLQRVLDMEEIHGVERENIPVYMDPHGWDLSDLDNIDLPRVSDFDKACGESVAWVMASQNRSEYELIKAMDRFPFELRIAAPSAILQGYAANENPLLFAMRQPFPIRLTLLILAFIGLHGSGGEPVQITSGLPPKPPAPGHWGGRTPGFEQPIPRSPEDLDVGPKR